MCFLVLHSEFPCFLCVVQQKGDTISSAPAQTGLALKCLCTRPLSRGLLPFLDEKVQAGLLGNKRQVGQVYTEALLAQQPPGDLAASQSPVNEPKHNQPVLIHPAKLSVCGIIDKIDEVLNITIDLEMFYGLSLVLPCLLIVMHLH